MPNQLIAPKWAPRLKPSGEWIVVSLVLSVAILSLLAWAQYRGALGVSRNDDWVYLHMEKWFLETGVFIVDSESMTNASGLIFTAAPFAHFFGYSITNLQIFVALIGGIGLLATWILVRTFLSRFWSSISILSMVFTPYWGSLTLSFMTDVPAYSLQTIGILFFLYSVRSKRINLYWFSAALLATAVAFTFREYAIVGGVAVVIGGLLVSLKKGTGNYVRTGLITLVSIFSFVIFWLYQWRTSLSNAKVSSFSISEAEVISAVYLLVAAVVTASIFMWPAIVSMSVMKIFTKFSWWRILIFLLAVVGVVLAGIRLSTKRSLTIGNYFGVSGSYAETLPLGEYPQLLPNELFLFIQWSGVVSAAVIVGLLMLKITDPQIFSQLAIKRLPFTFSDFPQAIVALFVFGTVLILGVVAGLTTAPLFDRYLLPLLPFGAALTISIIESLGIRAKLARLQSIAGLTVFAVLAAIYIDTALTVDGGQWKISSNVAEQGYEPSTIDGGYMWFGYHQDEVATSENLKPVKNWWTTLYNDPNVCAQVGLGIINPIETGGREVITRLKVTNIVGIEYDFWALKSPETCR